MVYGAAYGDMAARQGYTETERALVFTLRHEGKYWAEIEAHPLVTMKRSANKRWARRGDEGGSRQLGHPPQDRATTGHHGRNGR